MHNCTLDFINDAPEILEVAINNFHTDAEMSKDTTKGN